jgi:hypothetical protein
MKLSVQVDKNMVLMDIEIPGSTSSTNMYGGDAVRASVFGLLDEDSMREGEWDLYSHVSMGTSAKLFHL